MTFDEMREHGLARIEELYGAEEPYRTTEEVFDLLGCPEGYAERAVGSIGVMYRETGDLPKAIESGLLVAVLLGAQLADLDRVPDAPPENL